MMSFEWWEHKHFLYPHMSWPGTFYVKPNTVAWKDGAFTFKELADANYDKFPGGIYVGGKLNYQETDYLQTYDALPWGFVTRMSRRGEGKYGNAKNGFQTWAKDTRKMWSEIVSSHFEVLPDENKYG